MYIGRNNKLEFDLYLQLKKMVQTFENNTQNNKQKYIIKESKKIIEDYNWQF